MRGVFLEGHVGSETVLIYLELEGGKLQVRRSYGERALALELQLDDVHAVLDALEAEQVRRSRRTAIPGQTTIDDAVDEPVVVDHSDAT